MTDQTTPSEQAQRLAEAIAEVVHCRSQLATAKAALVTEENVTLRLQAQVERQEAELAELRQQKRDWLDNDVTGRTLLALQKEVAALESATQWHRVEDGLPAEGVEALWYHADWSLKVASVYRGEAPSIGLIGGVAPTHWMPLPPLPAITETNK